MRMWIKDPIAILAEGADCGVVADDGLQRDEAATDRDRIARRASRLSDAYSPWGDP
jgi:hypothetical protein